MRGMKSLFKGTQIEMKTGKANHDEGQKHSSRNQIMFLVNLVTECVSNSLVANKRTMRKVSAFVPYMILETLAMCCNNKIP